MNNLNRTEIRVGKHNVLLVSSYKVRSMVVVINDPHKGLAVIYTDNIMLRLL